jgi:RND family efflux transporter MFP subunit
MTQDQDPPSRRSTPPPPIPDGPAGTPHGAPQPAPHGVPTHAASENAPEPRPVAGRRVGITLAVVAAVFVLAFLVGTVPRLSNARALAAVANGDSVMAVEIQRVVRAPKTTNIALPGTLEPLHQAAIYARTSGYVKQWNVDIGRTVHAGEILAVIETPDLDQQLAQSRATLEQAKSGLELARVEQQRWAAMVKDSVVTVDEYDQKTQAARAAAALVDAGQADVSRLTALQSFEHVTAPFDGIVTGRNVDVGAFVQSGGGTGNSMPSNGSSAPSSLFQMAQTDTVRVYITVPQSDAIAIEAGQIADVRVQEFPNQVFAGRVVRTARAVDPQSRTLLTEVQIVNPKRLLLPGMYAEIRFVMSRVNPPLVVPATALLPLTDGIHVVEVGADSRVRHRKLNIVRDYGDYVEVDGGVSEGESVVLNPGDGLTDGIKVRAVERVAPSDSGARKIISPAGK